MDDTKAAFEALLQQHLPVLTRYVRYRIRSLHDAEDVIWETAAAAYRRMEDGASPADFRAWLLGIAKNKCTDYFRAQAKRMEIPVEALHDTIMTHGSCGLWERGIVRDTVSLLGAYDKQILYLYYWREYPQEKIAGLLGIPTGTVKSRLHTAKRNFRAQYPYPPQTEGKEGVFMTQKKLPEKIPAYTITARSDAPFPVVFEELTNWFIRPVVGDRVTWGVYDRPEGILTEQNVSEAVGRILLHGVEGVEIRTSTYNAEDEKTEDHIYYGQLTDTHCRWLGECYTDADGVKRMLTFLDGDEFMEEWGFGEDNCGNETHLAPKGDLVRDGSSITAADKRYRIDVVGRYDISIAGKVFDTVLIMMVYDNGAATEQYVDRNGRTVLWRRFNRNDWAQNRYKTPWTERLPDSDTLTVNGETYVHWYDCITDSIL